MAVHSPFSSQDPVVHQGGLILSGIWGAALFFVLLTASAEAQTHTIATAVSQPIGRVVTQLNATADAIGQTFAESVTEDEPLPKITIDSKGELWIGGKHLTSSSSASVTSNPVTSPKPRVRAQVKKPAAAGSSATTMQTNQATYTGKSQAQFDAEYAARVKQMNEVADQRYQEALNQQDAWAAQQKAASNARIQQLEAASQARMDQARADGDASLEAWKKSVGWTE